jgi:hypothetical protein
MKQLDSEEEKKNRRMPREKIKDMMERKKGCSRKTGLERLWRSRRWRLMRRLDSEEEKKDRRMPREKIKR